MWADVMTAVGVIVSNSYDKFQPPISSLGPVVAEILRRSLDDPKVRVIEARIDRKDIGANSDVAGKKTLP